MSFMRNPAEKKEPSIIETVVAERQANRVEAIERQIATLQERIYDVRLADVDTKRLATAVIHAEKEFESWQVGGKKDLLKLSKVEGTLHAVEVELERISSFVQKKPDEIEGLKKSLLSLNLSKPKVSEWVEKEHTKLCKLWEAAVEMEGAGFSEKRARKIEKEMERVTGEMEGHRA